MHSNCTTIRPSSSTTRCVPYSPSLSLTCIHASAAHTRTRTHTHTHTGEQYSGCCAALISPHHSDSGFFPPLLPPPSLFLFVFSPSTTQVEVSFSLFFPVSFSLLCQNRDYPPLSLFLFSLLLVPPRQRLQPPSVNLPPSTSLRTFHPPSLPPSLAPSLHPSPPPSVVSPSLPPSLFPLSLPPLPSRLSLARSLSLSFPPFRPSSIPPPQKRKRRNADEEEEGNEESKQGRG